MLIFNYIAEHYPEGKIAKFYKSYDSLNTAKKVLWWIMFINWIPMGASLLLLLIASILWNFIDCETFFWVSLGIVAVVFLPWIIYGFTSIFRRQ